MELRALLLHSPSIITTNGIPTSLSPCIHRQVPKYLNSTNYPSFRNPKHLDITFTAQQKFGAGYTRCSSTAVEATSESVNSKDQDLVFVAGATGKVGSRTVRELLKLGFRVKAGVRNAQRAENLVQSVKQMKPKGTSNAEAETQYIEKLEIVECDLEKPDRIEPALGNASVVICCIGASEKEVLDITGPYRIDYLATKNLIEAAAVAKVDHFILLTSLGTNKIGFPAAILNLFWGVLLWKRKAEEALLSSGLPYTIVRPGGMERPTDAFKETHNMRLSEEDTLFGGLVSNLQVAELIAFMAKNRSLSYCKVVEVVAETTAPLKPMEDLLTTIPSQRAETFSSKEPAASAANPSTAKTLITEAPTTSLEKEAAKDKEPEAVSKPDTGDLKSAVLGDSSSLAEKEPLQDKAVVTRSSSPYAAYEDLKPPSSPCPASPRGQKEVASISSRAVEVPPSLGDNGAPDLADSLSTGNGAPRDLKHYHSPYPVYEDFKPPVSPSPSSPNPPPISPSLLDKSGADSALAETAEVKEPPAEPKPKSSPHSPYTMFVDMKPPGTPVPTPQKH